MLKKIVVSAAYKNDKWLGLQNYGNMEDCFQKNLNTNQVYSKYITLQK